MRTAHRLASQSLPDYSCKFSRRDFTLPQLFACLVVKEQMKRSYRGAEALLRDSDNWLRDIGLRRAPDHNTLCRAARFLLRRCNVNRLLDTVARWATLARILGLSTRPLAIDSTSYESHHVSRHYERRCQETRRRIRAKEFGKHAAAHGRGPLGAASRAPRVLRRLDREGRRGPSRRPRRPADARRDRPPRQADPTGQGEGGDAMNAMPRWRPTPPRWRPACLSNRCSDYAPQASIQLRVCICDRKGFLSQDGSRSIKAVRLPDARRS